MNQLVHNHDLVRLSIELCHFPIIYFVLLPISRLSPVEGNVIIIFLGYLQCTNIQKDLVYLFVYFHFNSIPYFHQLLTGLFTAKLGCTTTYISTQISSTPFIFFSNHNSDFQQFGNKQEKLLIRVYFPFVNFVIFFNVSQLYISHGCLLVKKGTI